MDCIAGTKLMESHSYNSEMFAYSRGSRDLILRLLHTSVQDSKWIQRGAMKQQFMRIEKYLHSLMKWGSFSKPDDQLGLGFRMLRWILEDST